MVNKQYKIRKKKENNYIIWRKPSDFWWFKMNKSNEIKWNKINNLRQYFFPFIEKKIVKLWNVAKQFLGQQSYDFRFL